MPETQPSKSEARKHYFVDEAGDAVLFGGLGKVLIGSNGCSRSFMLGLLDVHGPERLATELAELRKNLLADSYFKGVPSMQTYERKTALSFCMRRPTCPKSSKCSPRSKQHSPRGSLMAARPT